MAGEIVEQQVVAVQTDTDHVRLQVQSTSVRVELSDAVTGGQGQGTLAFDIRDYGAVAGMTDATAAIQAAHTAAKNYVTANVGEGAEIVIPRGLWNIATPGGIVCDTPRIRFRGVGGTIRKKVNGPIFTINYQAGAGEPNVGVGVEMVELFIDGNYSGGGGYTGATITLANCADFIFRNSKIINGHVGSPLFIFTVSGQVRRRISHNVFRIAGTPQNIGIFDTSIDNGGLPAPDFMFDFNDCTGGVIDGRGCNNLYLRGNTCSNILTDSISNKLFAVGNRIASSGFDVTLYGGNHLVSSNLCNIGNFVLGAGLHHSEIGPNHLPGGTTSFRVIDRSGATSNVLPAMGQTRWSARVANATNQTISNNFATPLVFNTDVWDTNGVHDPVTNNTRLWLRKGGDWHLGAVVQWAANASGTYRFAAVRINGTTKDVARMAVPPINSGTIRTRLNMSTIWRANEPSDLTGTTTNGSSSVTNVVVATYSLAPTVGQAIEGAGIPANARIGSITGSTYGLVDPSGAAINATASATGVSLTSTDYAEIIVQHDAGTNLDVEGGTSPPQSPAWAKYLD